MRFSFIITLLLYSTFHCSAQLGWQWANQGKTNTKSVTDVEFLCKDSVDNLYITVLTFYSPPVSANVFLKYGNDSFILQGIPNELFLMSTDSNGAYRWGYTTKNMYCCQTVMDSRQNLVCVGTAMSDSVSFGNQSFACDSPLYSSVIAKIAPNGTLIWSTTFNSISTAYLAGADSANNLYVSGTFLSDTLHIGTYTLLNSAPGSHTYDIYLVKFDSAGNVVWAKSFGGDATDYPKSMAVTHDGFIYYVGEFQSDSLALGSYTLHKTGFTGYNYFISKFNSSGQVVWVDSINRFNENIALNKLKLDYKEDNLYILGNYYDSMKVKNTTIYGAHTPEQALVLSLNANGDYNWSKQFNNAMFFDLNIDICKNIWIQGNIMGSADPDTMNIYRLDSLGDRIDSMQFRAGGDDIAPMAFDNKGHFYISGDVMKNMALGNDSLTVDSLGGERMFVAKYRYSYCGDTTNSHNTIINNVKGQNSISVYPNPSENIFYIDHIPATSELYVYDIIGRKIFETYNISGKMQLNALNWPAGIYILQLYDMQGNSKVYKLVKK